MKAPSVPLAGQDPVATSSSQGSIKEAYSKWLHEVHADTQPRVRKSRKRIKKLLALRHLQQPTESSAKKHADTPANGCVPAPRRAAPLPTTDSDAATATGNTVLEENQRRRRRQFQSLADEASCAHFHYESPWAPGLAFFAALASHAKSKNRPVGGFRETKKLKKTSSMRCEIADFPVQLPATALRLGDSDGVVLMFTTERQPPENESDKVAKPATTTTTSNTSDNNTSDNNDKPTGAALKEWVLQFHFFAVRDVFETRLPWVVRIVTSHRTFGGSAPMNSVVALQKTAKCDGRANGNALQVLDSMQAVEHALLSLWNPNEPELNPHDPSQHQWKAVQAYVPSSSGNSNSNRTNASSRAWIARPVYRKKSQVAATVWILTGEEGSQFASTQWTSDDSGSPPCQIVKSVNTQSWQEPRAIVERLSQWLDTHLARAASSSALAFAELVVDLVQDPQGDWWLLQVKAFQLQHASQRVARLPLTQDSTRAKSAPDRLEATPSVAMVSSRSSSSHMPVVGAGAKKTKWKCTGKYCHLDASSSSDSVDPSGHLTKKELLSCEFYDRFQVAHGTSSTTTHTLGGDKVATTLAFYLQYQLHKRDRTALYEPQPLCGCCLQKYYALRTELTKQINLESELQRGGTTELTKKVQPRGKRLVPMNKSLATLTPMAAARREDPQPPAATVSSSTFAKASLTSSSSTPVIGNSGSGALLPFSYLDELDRIEKLLADQDEPVEEQQAQPPLIPSATTSNANVAPTTTTEAASFSWIQATAQDGGDDCIEKMWQSVKLTPLSTQIPATTAAEPQPRPYNTISLDAAWKESHSSSVASLHDHRPLAVRENKQDPPHLISILDCRRVISDENFRERLVQEAIRYLVHGHQAVQFVVLPSEDEEDGGSEGNHHTKQSLGRMALRSLALDIAQVVEQEQSTGMGGGQISLIGGLPPIVEDAAKSGALFMTLPAC